MLTYVSSVKLTALLSSETDVQGSRKNMPGTYQPECSHHAVIPTLGTHQQNKLVLLTILVIPLYKIHSYKFITTYMYTNSDILTTLDAHIFSMRLRFKFILMSTWTSTQQFIDHIPACCQSNSSLAGLPSLWWQYITKNQRHTIGLQRLLGRSKPFQHVTSKILW